MEESDDIRPDPAQRPAPAPLFFREGLESGALATPERREQGELQREFEGLLDATAALGRKPRGVYTAETFRASDPHRYQVAKVALGMGYPVNTVAKTLGIAWETAKAIQRAEDDQQIREVKRKFALGLEGVIELGIEGLMRQAKDGKLTALDLCQLADKWLLLSGEATSITETRRESPAVAAYREFMAMGSAGGENFQSGGGAPGAVRVVDGKVLEDGTGGVEPLGPK